MAVQFIQTNNNTSTTANNAINFSSLPKAGNFIVVAIGTNNYNQPTEVTSVTDNAVGGTNTYTRAVSAIAASYPTADIWYAENVNPAAVTHTITANVITGINFIQSAVIQEFSGVAYSGSLDVTASNTTNTTTTITSGTTAVTNQATELIIVAACQSPSPGTFTAGSGFSNMDYNPSTQTPVAMESMVVSSVGTQSGTMTRDHTDNAVGLIATFRASLYTTTTSTSSSTSSTSTSISSTSMSTSSTSMSTSSTSVSTTTSTLLDPGWKPEVQIQRRQ